VNVEAIENNQTANGEGKVGEEIPPEVISSENSTERRAQDEKKSDKNENWRKIWEGVPLKHVSYPHAPSK